MSKLKAKEGSSIKKKFLQLVSMLENLAAMNAMKIELRQYNLAIIITQYVAVLGGHILIK